MTTASKETIIDEAAEALDLIESAGLEDASTGASGADAIRVLRGNPSDQEIAALVAVLTAAAGTDRPVGDGRPPELWGTPASMHRTFAPHSPYSYAASQRY